MREASSAPPVAYAEKLLDWMRREDFRRATFGGKCRNAAGFRLERVIVRAVEIRGERLLQVSRFDGKKDLSANVRAHELPAEIGDVLAAGFANVHVTMAAEEIDLRLTKKGELSIGRKTRIGGDAGVQPHNRVKELPLPEGKADRLLEVMGIMTSEGVVRPTMRAKFTQINEFLRILETVLPAVGGNGQELRILDCGCGSSYLTIAAHHYLNEIKGIRAQVLGVDVNEELVRKSTERAESLHGGGDASTLSFASGRIGQLQGVHPDIVLALHACDTATDDAIAQAITSEAKVLLAAPCCHKDLHGKLEIPALRPVQRHGILHQRLADLVTDSFRALVLRVMGYRAEVIEFISPEHTARNLMIRAVKSGRAGDAEAVREYQGFKRFTGVAPYLEKALGERLTGIVA